MHTVAASSFGVDRLNYFDIVPNIVAKIKDEPDNFSHYNSLYTVCENITDINEKYKATNLLKECCIEGIAKKTKITSKLTQLF